MHLAMRSEPGCFFPAGQGEWGGIGCCLWSNLVGVWLDEAAAADQAEALNR